jgi:hypothetical protein
MTDYRAITIIDSDTRRVPPPPPGPRPDEVWQQARHLAADEKGGSHRPESPAEAIAWALAMWRAGRMQEEDVHHTALAALAIWMGTPIRGIVEGLILAGEPAEKIAQEVNVAYEVIGIYECVFFAVRPHRNDAAWIDYYAIRRDGRPALYDAEYFLRYFAHHLGRRAFDVARGVMTGEALDRFSEMEIRAVTATIEAMRMPIGQKARLAWLQKYLNLPCAQPEWRGRDLPYFTQSSEALRQFWMRQSQWDPIVVLGNAVVETHVVPQDQKRLPASEVPTRPRQRAQSKRKPATGPTPGTPVSS